MNDKTEMKTLEIDLGEVTFAMQDGSELVDNYLDLETGKLVMVTDETRWDLQQIYKKYHNPEAAADFNLGETLRQINVSGREQQMLLEADRVEREYRSRYISVPQATSHEGYSDMEDFIATVSDEQLQTQLWEAIQGRGAFRHFKDVLAYHPGERKRWFEFKDNLMQQYVGDWLNSEGIKPIFTLPSIPKQPPVRPKFIKEVLFFVRAARKLSGVTRIALIGSLTSDKQDPKDVDILVTVINEADLETLATLGRKLNGHLQQINRGGEVFLADPQGNYLGRTCPWKRCEPGIRMSCKALHCGQRHYLYNDLNSVKLAKELILSPPIVLWPQVASHVPLPTDIEQDLIALL